MNNVAPLPRLPLDVLEIVFEHLDPNHGDDVLALRACAQVCSGWARGAQKRIFSSVKVSTKPQRKQFWETLVASPHLASLIRLLCVSSMPLFFLKRDITETVLLPNVHTLFLDKSSFEHTFLSYLPGLRILHVRECLSTIAPNASDFPATESSPASSFGGHLKLTSFVFETDSYARSWTQNPILAHLLQRGITDGITATVLGLSCYVDWDIAGRFVCSAAALKDMRIVIWEAPGRSG
jgi:hypothetical protein